MPAPAPAGTYGDTPGAPFAAEPRGATASAVPGLGNPSDGPGGHSLLPAPTAASSTPPGAPTTPPAAPIPPASAATPPTPPAGTTATRAASTGTTPPASSATPTPAPGSLAWWLQRHAEQLAGRDPSGPEQPPGRDPAPAVHGSGGGGLEAPGEAGDGRPATARRPLDLDTLAAAALRIVDAGGLDTLTMRRLADDVGVGMAAIYRIVPSRQALLSEVLDRVLGLVEEPEPRLAARQALERWSRSIRAALFAHPAAAALLPADQLAGPCAMRLREVALTFLLRSGLSPADAAIVYWAVVDFTIGATVLDLAAAGSDVERADIYARLPAERYPSIVAAAEHTRAQEGKAFDLGLTSLLAGVAQRFPGLDRTP